METQIEKEVSEGFARIARHIPDDKTLIAIDADPETALICRNARLHLDNAKAYAIAVLSWVNGDIEKGQMKAALYYNLLKSKVKDGKDA